MYTLYIESKELQHFEECWQTQEAVTCTRTDNVAAWNSPQSGSTPITTISYGQVSNVDYWFIAALVSINNHVPTSNISFTGITVKNGTQVRYVAI